MRTPLIVLLLALVNVGCSRAGSAATITGANAPPTGRTAAPSSPTSYNTLRKRLLLDGWLPLHNASCAEQVSHPLSCNRWLELQRCDAGGRCSMAWGDAAGRQIMRVRVRGMPVKDTVEFRTANVKLIASQQTPAQKALTVATACPGDDFTTFLPAFAGQAAVRQAFTAPLVRANILVSDGDGDRTETVYVPGNRPEVFDVIYRDGAFHHVGVDGTDAARLPLDIHKPSATVREVSYLYGSSEGRNFRFTRHDGCWYLSGNPQPTGP